MIVYIGSFHIVLGLIAFVSYIVIGIVVPLTASKMSQKYGKAFREEFGNLDAFVLDSLRGVKESIQYGSGKERLQEIQTYSSSLLEKEKKLKGAAGTSAAVTSGMILVQSTLAGLGYNVELVDLMKVQIPVAIIAVGVAIVYYYLKDKQLSRKETK